MARAMWLQEGEQGKEAGERSEGLPKEHGLDSKGYGEFGRKAQDLT